MNYNLPVAENNFPEVVNPETPENMVDVKESFENYIAAMQMLENAISQAEERCRESEEAVEDAKNYNDAWYKIGSTKKKVRMIAEAQSSMQEAINSLQYGQSLTFKFQQSLARFCAICLQFCRSNENKLDDLSKILVAIEERSKQEEINPAIMTEVNNLRNAVEQEKEKIRIMKKADDEKGKIVVYGFGFIVILAAILFFVLK